jgi:cytochrome c oxidase assembly factor CtaG
VFVALMPMTVLGVGMVLAGTPWYELHRDLADQQVAGVVMWAGGSLLALAGVLTLGAAWVGHAGA